MILLSNDSLMKKLILIVWALGPISPLSFHYKNNKLLSSSKHQKRIKYIGYGVNSRYSATEER